MKDWTQLNQTRPDPLKKWIRLDPIRPEETQYFKVCAALVAVVVCSRPFACPPVSVVSNGSSNQAPPPTISVVANKTSNQTPSPPTRNQLNFLKLRGVPIFQFRKPNQATSKTQISANSIETSQDSSRVRTNNRSARKLPKFPGCIVS